MTILIGPLKRFRESEPRAATPVRQTTAPAPAFAGAAIDIAANDPALAYFLSNAGAIDLDSLELDSVAVRNMRAAGVKLVVPLVSQGELIGLLNLGQRLSEQDYSGDDRRLLENLAGHVAPAVRVAQLVRQQEAEARTRERVEQQLRVAQLIQQNFLPREIPDLPGWQLAAYYQPAWEVGGDFYDFIHLADGRLGIVIGDVTDKGIPAALVMAATKSMLRAAAQESASPGEVLARANDLLCPDMPAKMFATCLYAVLDVDSGRVDFANAGHNVPYMRTASGVQELRATGMPLGLMPGMTYEEKSVTLAPGDNVLFHSDGLVEAHNPVHDMFGFPRLMGLVGKHSSQHLIDQLLADLASFTGANWQQEDDVTLVSLSRATAQDQPPSPMPTGLRELSDGSRLLAQFQLESVAGNERLAIEHVSEAVSELGIETARLERLKTAVGEATMNAMEHGNKYQPDLPVSIRVSASDSALTVEIVDHGGDKPLAEPDAPDLEAKLAGIQTPRGWGLFLIKNMVDDLRATSDGTHHTLALVMELRGDGDGK
jgi:serine phosphatase RsbU (regulator of sigma subunit)/anti-sigma regulatory factor (Ser/Thr protein kinase)